MNLIIADVNKLSLRLILQCNNLDTGNHFQCMKIRRILNVDARYTSYIRSQISTATHNLDLDVLSSNIVEYEITWGKHLVNLLCEAEYRY